MGIVKEIVELTHHTDHLSLDPSLVPADSRLASEFSPPVSTHLGRIYKTLKEPAKFDFLRDVQHESQDVDATRQGPADPLASLDTFAAYMSSTASSAARPAKRQELSSPIADYFISSSHNTYLTGNQLYSDAAASAYANVLLTGCRCVEIDIWDGGSSDDDGEDDTSSSSSDDSSPDEKKVARRKKQDNPKKEKPSRMKSVSSRLGGLLGHKSPHHAESAPKETGVAAGTAMPVPPRPEPKVLHGHTLTKEVTFRDVCHVIRDNAFVTSDLPVIVSLEVHASLEQQAMMVEIMEETWKGMLVEVTPEIAATNSLPPPEALKRKILIKVKYVAPTSQGEADDMEDDRTDELEPSSHQQPSQGVSNSLATTGDPSAPPAKKPSKILHALSRLAVFTKGFHFSHFTQPEAKVPGHVFSLSESAARAAYAKERDALFEHNRHHFMRVYPYGLRVTSSNYDPTPFWRCGAQIVALNWQYLDKGMMLNHAMFDGEQGWVLKPQGYRGSDPPGGGNIIRSHLELTIEVLAGQAIPLPPGDTKEKGFHPYVSCLLHIETPPEEESGSANADDSTDSDETSYKRTIKSDYGSNPDFGGQKLEFPKLSGIIEEFTFVRFKVKDDEFGRDSMAAWACIKLNRLQAGYRLIHLLDCSGRASGGVLLVHITKDIS
ncbi:putative phosphoinositide-specific phospholipase C [Aspergillus affinis]|uniref:putative phosphoinositide-specific phospholipase C n=1 Tax=Aspergillus affinis TaxID=1070780 RepID=UPI0022FF0D80|nr:phosphoinositide-specific phospholipase C [Aspergillus affinis]KAI9045630.1 phosphoinositide-specific phospholipase C [Aspergillus affinis]